MRTFGWFKLDLDYIQSEWKHEGWKRETWERVKLLKDVTNSGWANRLTTNRKNYPKTEIIL